jgi:hypothetical protein
MAKWMLLLVLLISAGCKKEVDPREYAEGSLVAFIGAGRPGYTPPLTIIQVSFRSPAEIKYYAKDANGKMMNDLSDLEIKPWN